MWNKTDGALWTSKQKHCTSLREQDYYHTENYFITMQRAKKVVPDSPGLVDFAIRLVNSVINLPKGQVKVFKEFKLQKNREINLLVTTFLGLVKMMFGLVNVSFSLPEWQAVKMTFFWPAIHKFDQSIKKVRIIRHFWQTALLPLPWANFYTYFSLREKCWLKGGVGGQFLRYIIMIRKG